MRDSVDEAMSCDADCANSSAAGSCTRVTLAAELTEAQALAVAAHCARSSFDNRVAREKLQAMMPCGANYSDWWCDLVYGAFREISQDLKEKGYYTP